MTADGARTDAAVPTARRRGVDVLGLIGVILAGLALLPSLAVFLIGLIPEMNAIWWLGILIIPALGIVGAVVAVLGVIGLILGIRARGRYALSIVAIVLAIVLIAPIALLYFGSAV
jgi:hypothetical protein